MLFTGLTGAKIKQVILQKSDGRIDIIKESLFNKKSISSDLNKLKVELKLASGKKGAIIPKIKLVFLSDGKQIEKMESGFLSLNNSKIKDLYYELKSILENEDKTYV